MQKTKKEKKPHETFMTGKLSHITGISSDQQPRESYLLHFKPPS